jgi:hypothetical protein
VTWLERSIGFEKGGRGTIEQAQHRDIVRTVLK